MALGTQSGNMWKELVAFTTPKEKLRGKQKSFLLTPGGGEVRIQDRHGLFRDSDTVPPANDPFPPRDRRH